MVKKSERFRLWIEPEVHRMRELLPGNIRQRVKRMIDALPVEPHPAGSRPLDIEELDVPIDIEIRRLKLDRWRILYAVNEREGWVWVLQIRKRPPYQYEDLPEIVAKIS